MIKPVAITIVVSSTLAYFLTTFNIPFLPSFLLAIVVQFIGWSIVEYFANIKKQEIASTVLSDIVGQSLLVPCPYCKKDNLTPIRFDQNNEIKCEHCDKTGAIYIDIQTVQVTKPLEVQQTITVNERT